MQDMQSFTNVNRCSAASFTVVTASLIPRFRIEKFVILGSRLGIKLTD